MENNDVLTEFEIESLTYEQNIKEIKKHVNFIKKLILYCSFFSVLFITITVILRGFKEGIF